MFSVQISMAQYEFQAIHLPEIGQEMKFEVKRVNSSSYTFASGDTGLVWNVPLSGSWTDSSREVYISPSLAYGSSYFPSSNLALRKYYFYEWNGVNRIDTIYQFFEKSNEGLVKLGEIDKGSLSPKFLLPPMPLIKVPVAFGTSINDTAVSLVYFREFGDSIKKENTRITEYKGLGSGILNIGSKSYPVLYAILYNTTKYIRYKLDSAGQWVFQNNGSGFSQMRFFLNQGLRGIICTAEKISGETSYWEFNFTRNNPVPFTSVADEFMKEPEMAVFPNPMDDSFLIEGLSTGCHYQIFDGRGNLIDESVWEGKTIGTAGIPGGIYHIRAVDHSGRYLASKRFVVRH